MSESEEQPTAAEEEQLRAAYEAELARIDTGEMILQAAVSLLNLGALRLAPAGEQGPPQDLEQAREAIDAVRGLLDVLERRGPRRSSGFAAPWRSSRWRTRGKWTRRHPQAAPRRTAAPLLAKRTAKRKARAGPVQRAPLGSRQLNAPSACNRAAAR